MVETICVSGNSSTFSKTLRISGVLGWFSMTNRSDLGLKSCGDQKRTIGMFSTQRPSCAECTLHMNRILQKRVNQMIFHEFPSFSWLCGPNCWDKRVRFQWSCVGFSWAVSLERPISLPWLSMRLLGIRLLPSAKTCLRLQG